MSASLVQSKTTKPGWDGTKFVPYPKEPNAKQYAFHASKARYKALIGGFGAGKTLPGCLEVIQHCLAFPGNRWLICRKDYTTLRDSTMKTFFDLIPKNSPLVVKWNETTHDLALKTDGKPSEIMFRGTEDFLQFGSYELGGFYIDQAEQVPEVVFKMLQSRLRLQGVRHCGIITPNPPNQFHWIYRIFKKNFDPKIHFVVHTSTYDNKENLPKAYIEDLEKQPENWKKMYLYGEYGFMAEGDAVYPDFREGIHVAKESLVPTRHVSIVRSIDPGFLFPACGWYQYISSKDRVHKLAELMIPNTTADVFADMILDHERKIFPGRHPQVDFENVGDPALDQATDKSEQTSRQIYESKGIQNIQCRRTFIKDGINLIRRELLVRDDGKPSYIIDPSCQLTQEAYLGGYFLKEDSDIPDDKCHPYCDVADTDRYFFVNKVQIVQPVQAKEYYHEPEVRRHGVTGY